MVLALIMEQACPHVAGLVAYILSIKGQMKPANMKKQIAEWGTKDKLKLDGSEFKSFRDRIVTNSSDQSSFEDCQLAPQE